MKSKFTIETYRLNNKPITNEQRNMVHMGSSDAQIITHIVTYGAALVMHICIDFD